MARSAVPWLAGALLLLAFSAWYVLRPAGRAEVQGPQRVFSDLEVRERQTLAPVPDAPLRERASQEVERGRTDAGSLAAEPVISTEVIVTGLIRAGGGIEPPVPDARLVLFQNVDGKRVAAPIEFRSERDGSFREKIQVTFPTDEHGESASEVELELQAWAPGFQEGWDWEDVEPEDPEDPKDPDECEASFSIRLERGCTLEGRVVDVRGALVEYADVFAMLAGGGDNAGQTGEDGTFRISFERAGPIELKARLESVGVSESVAVNLRSDLWNEVEDLVIIERGGEIAGVLVDSFGRPIEGNYLNASAEEWLAALGYSIDEFERPSAVGYSSSHEFESLGLVRSHFSPTGKDGSFRFKGMAPGRFLIVSKPHAGKVDSWIVSTGQTDLRLSREYCHLRVEVEAGDRSGLALSGSAWGAASLELAATGKKNDKSIDLIAGTAWVPVRTGVEYVVGGTVGDGRYGALTLGYARRLEIADFYFKEKLIYEAERALAFDIDIELDRARRISLELLASHSKWRGCSFERKVWIAPGDKDPVLRLVVDLEKEGLIEIRSGGRPVRARAIAWIERDSGSRVGFLSSFVLEVPKIERWFLAPGPYTVELSAEPVMRNWRFQNWCKRLVDPPSGLSFPPRVSFGLPRQPRYPVDLKPDKIHELNVEFEEAGAALLLLSSQESSPRMTHSTLTLPGGETLSEATDSCSTRTEPAGTVTILVVRLPLLPGEYVWEGSATGFQDLEAAFAIQPGELTVIRKTWLP
jgi:hypothetical protein